MPTGTAQDGGRNGSYGEGKGEGREGKGESRERKTLPGNGVTVANVG
jgi:hypothetical protein